MKRLHVLITSLCLTLLTGLTLPVQADDTELYINMSGSATMTKEIRPNILFVLDSSASMNWPLRDEVTGDPVKNPDTGKDKTRIDVLRGALLKTLDRIDNVNLGLGRFTQDNNNNYTNAAILYPVAYVDAPIAEIEGKKEGPLLIPVSAPIIESTDDAEENNLDKKVDTQGTNLELTEIPESTSVGVLTEGKIALRTGASSPDDAKEYLGDGSGGSYDSQADHAVGKVWTESTPVSLLPLGGYTGPTYKDIRSLNLWNGDTLVGLRFSNRKDDTMGLDIPQGAIITKAEVVFTAADTTAYEQDKLSLTIQGGYDQLAVSPFSNTKPKSVSEYGVTANTFKVKTSDGKPMMWNDIPAFETGKMYAVDVQRLVQSIVDDGCTGSGTTKTCDGAKGWKYGSKLALFFERKRVNDSGDPLTKGMRVVETAESSTSGAPMLRVYWYKSAGSMDVLTKFKDSTGRILNTEQRKEYIESGTAKGEANYVRLGNDPYNRRGSTKVGVRFEVPIPPKAKITDAKIVFTHQSATYQKDGEAGRNPLDLMIYAEKVADATSLSSLPLVADRIKEDKRTTAVAEWNNVPPPPAAFKYSSTVKPTTSDIDQNIEQFTTPPIIDILKEIVNQADWKSGNRIAFLFESKGTSAGSRRFVANMDTTSDIATAFTTVKPTLETLPKLQVTYSVGDPNDLDESQKPDPKARKQTVGLRFQGVTVPRGAEIVNAKITFTSKQLAEEAARLLIQTEQVNYGPDVDSKPFEAKEGNISTRKLSEGVEWFIANPWEEGGKYDTPPDLIKNLVSQAVSQEGWCGGSTSLTFVISAKDDKEKPFRAVSSFEDAPDKAPVLNIEYNADSVKEGGCLNQAISRRISDPSDDAEEFFMKEGVSSDEVDVKSTALELLNTGSGPGRYERTVGLRFPDIPIKAGTTIKSAYLSFVAADNKPSATKLPVTIEIAGQKGNAPEFSPGVKNGISSRSKTSKKVSWEPEVWSTLETEYKTKDISGIIDEIINEGAWETNDDLAFILTQKEGVGYRSALSANKNPARAPKLTIQIEGELEGGGLETVRLRLKQAVKKMEMGTWTNVVDGFYEAAQYFRGSAVSRGLDRHGSAKHLVSHPVTYGSTGVTRDLKCTDMYPFDPICATERINGQPNYTSPIQEGGELGGGVGNCPISGKATNYIVLLTDGVTNRNQSVDGIKQMVGKCASTKVSAEECGRELATYLATHNMGSKGNKELEGTKVCLHTIGFQLGKAWEPVKVPKVDADNKPVLDSKGRPVMVNKLDADGKTVWQENVQETQDNILAKKFLEDLAASSCSDSKYFDANTEEELSTAFESIVAGAIVSSASFAAPSISVSAVNRLYHRNEVYYAVFKPGQTQRWHGNVKKYHVCTGTMVEKKLCDKVGVIVDAEGKSVVNPETRYIQDTAKSFWSRETDGNDITAGGAGSRIPSYTERNVLTYLDDATPGQNHQIKLQDYGLTKEFAATEKSRLQKAFGDLSDLEGVKGVEDIVEWISGKDVTSEKSDGDGRWRFADPLHSSPAAVTYYEGGKEIVRLVVGTNDGLIRMINAQDEGANAGVEEWAFLPAELLSIQPALIANQVSGSRIYGVDGTPSIWFDVDKNKNSVVDEDDTVHAYIGMRRGGSNIYALDISNADSPELIWTIKGATEGNGASFKTQTPSPGFEKLAQSWSQPKPTKVIWNGKLRKVLLFGGGFDPRLEGEGGELGFKESKVGNAIFMVDLEKDSTGNLLWWASNEREAAGGTAQFLALPEMKYAIPSALELVDSDSDLNTDRLYVGDLGGQVWRIDLVSLGSGNKATGFGGRLANISQDGVSENRRFFYPPSVYIDGNKENDWVTITTGSRPIPLDSQIHDQFFAFKDRAVNGLKKLAAADGTLTVEDCNPDKGMSNLPFCTIRQESLYDSTPNLKAGLANSQEAGAETQDSESTVQMEEEKLAKSLGWFLNLQADYDYATGDLVRANGAWKGEKGLASPIILETDDGLKVFFSTYTPWSKGMPLEKCEGLSRLYGLDLTSGTGKSKSLKNGITSDISPMFVEGGGMRLIMNDPTLTRCGMEEDCDILQKNPPGDAITDPFYGALLKPKLERQFWQQIFSGDN